MKIISFEMQPLKESLTRFRLIWTVCVAIGAVATTVIIVSLWEKFQTNPTITGLDTDFHNWEVPFPAITVCQSIPSNSSNIENYLLNKNDNNDTFEDKLVFLTKLTQLSYETMRDFENHTNKGYLPSDEYDLKSTVFGLMNKCQDIFDVCEWKSYKYNCCDGFFPVFTENGFCYSFNSRHYEKKLPGHEEEIPGFQMQYIKETDIKWSLKFSVQDGNENIKMPIYIHNSDEVPGLDMQPQHIWEYKVDKISFSVKQTYTTEDARQLTIKQRHCVYENEIKLKIDCKYTYTACTSQCRMQTATKRCRCVPHFYPDVGNFRHCTLPELKCIAENLEAIRATDKCFCELGCSNTVYEVEKLNENQEGDSYNLEAEFVSWPMVRYKREVLFGWVDLLVSFGGIAGLFLGFSLLSGVEVLYYFTIRACCMVYRGKDELQLIQWENKRKPKPDYDLSLYPYFYKRPLQANGMSIVAEGYYNRNIGLDKSKIAPLTVKAKTPQVVYAPFGIEFIH